MSWRWAEQLEQLWWRQQPRSAPLHLAPYLGRERSLWWRLIGWYGGLPAHYKACALGAAPLLWLLGSLLLGLYWQQQSIVLAGEVAREQWQRANQQSSQSQLAALVELESWHAGLVSEISPNALLNELLAQAQSLGLAVENGEILAEESSGLGPQHWLRLRLRGDFHALTDLLQRFERPERLLLLERMHLQPGSQALRLDLRLRYLPG